ncbi:MAG TPA: hypothetical protein VMU96_10490 [Casimicrobiaceae bacterium]|nr:hypothetical protein [Casimicrobiaceae bacterium]
MLVGLVIVALLAKEALKQLGLLQGKPTAEKAASPGERARAAGAMGVDATALDTGAPQGPASALDRARSVGDTLQRQADERAKAMDGVK